MNPLNVPTFVVRAYTLRTNEEAYLFQKLPLQIKKAVGFEFDPKDIEQAVLSGRIPEFWNEEAEPYVPPVTRSKQQIEEPVFSEQELQLSQAQAENLFEDEFEDKDEKHVTFQDEPFVSN